jgi:hypothetical protein
LGYRVLCVRCQLHRSGGFCDIIAKRENAAASLIDYHRVRLTLPFPAIRRDLRSTSDKKVHVAIMDDPDAKASEEALLGSRS